MDCKRVSPKNSHVYANGVVLVDEGRTLLVNDVVLASTTVYNVDPDSKMLTLQKRVVC